MTKNYLKLLVGGLLGLLIKQASAQIPNASFEKWDTTNFSGSDIINPSGWMSTNLHNVNYGFGNSITPTTDSYSGLYAIKMENHNDSLNNGMAAYLFTHQGDVKSNGSIFFPVQGKVLKLNGFYKYATPEIDSFEINIYLFKNGNYVGEGTMHNAVQTNAYLPFSVPVAYISSEIPDSASINIYSSSEKYTVIPSTLYIDELSLVYETTGISKKTGEEQKISVFPNPATDELTIKFNLNAKSNIDVNVYDITGQLVTNFVNNKFFDAGENQISNSLNGLKHGMYFVSIQPKVGSTVTQKFIVK